MPRPWVAYLIVVHDRVICLLFLWIWYRCTSDTASDAHLQWVSENRLLKLFDELVPPSSPFESRNRHECFHLLCKIIGNYESHSSRCELKNYFLFTRGWCRVFGTFESKLADGQAPLNSENDRMQSSSFWLPWTIAIVLVCWHPKLTKQMVFYWISWCIFV